MVNLGVESGKSIIKAVRRARAGHAEGKHSPSVAMTVLHPTFLTPLRKTRMTRMLALCGRHEFALVFNQG